MPCLHLEEVPGVIESCVPLLTSCFAVRGSNISERTIDQHSSKSRLHLRKRVCSCTDNRLVTVVVHLALYFRMRVCMCIFLVDCFALFDTLGQTQICVRSGQTTNGYLYKHDLLTCIQNLVHRVRHRWTFQNVRCDQRRSKHKASMMYLHRLAWE